MGFNLQTLARPNILALEPYRCARDDFKVGVLLDANENTHGPLSSNLTEQEKKLELNRYPDPHQIELKQQICDFRNLEANTEGAEIPLPDSKPLTPANLALGVGSDESIDAMIRCFCVPGKDKMLVCPPTYGMYSVCANVNDVEILEVPLDLTTFQIQPELIIEKLNSDPSIKLLYITTPGNPTGKQVDFNLIEKVLLNEKWNGVVIADEAYVDFSPIGSSLAPLVNKYPNFVVLQTLSKSFGLAGIRLGIAYCDLSIALLLNSMKYPYNISNLTSDVALRATTKEAIKEMRLSCEVLNANREALEKQLLEIKGVSKNIGGKDANFLLMQLVDANGEPSNEVAKQVYNKLAVEQSVVVRFRGTNLGCTGCLRVTVGTKEENEIVVTKFLEVLDQVLNN